LAGKRSGSLDTIEVDLAAITDFLVYKGLFNEKETCCKFILKTLEIKLEDNNQIIMLSNN